MKLHEIDGGQLLAEPLLLQDIGHPVGKVVRRLGRQVLVLGEKVVGVEVDHRARHVPQMFQQFGQVTGTASGE